MLESKLINLDFIIWCLQCAYQDYTGYSRGCSIHSLHIKLSILALLARILKKLYESIPKGADRKAQKRSESNDCSRS